MPGVTLHSIAPAHGWWLVHRLGPGAGDELPDEAPGEWRRTPLAAWVLVDDGPGLARYLVGAEAVVDHVDLARPGLYRHVAAWPACACGAPDVEALDPGLCTRCAGLVGER